MTASVAQPPEPVAAEAAAAKPSADQSAKPKSKMTERFIAGVTPEYAIREILLGVSICFAQIPDSVAYSFIAHVKPPIALHASWMMGLICSVFGGRPGMINGATGAYAAIICTFIPAAGTGLNGEGVELLFPSVIVAGVLMMCVSAANLTKFITLLPAPVMIGFCNGLGIVIGLAQLHPFKDKVTHEWKSGPELMWMLIICFTSAAIMELLPKVRLNILKVIPSSLLAIIAAVIIEFAIVRGALGHRTDVIRDVCEFTLDTARPIPFFLNSDYDYGEAFDSKVLGDNIGKIILQGILLCIVGTIESLLTSEVVESFVKTPSDGNRTVLAMGVGNIISGFLGGMGGNALIGLSTVNCLKGGKGRLGPMVTALGVLACVMGAYPLLNYIPIAALTGIMMVVVYHTFKWSSLAMIVASMLPKSVRDRLGPRFQRKVPRVDLFVICAVTVLSNYPKGTNIAYAVGVGVAICAINYAWKSGKTFTWKESFSADGTKYYDIDGHLFFAAANRFIKVMNPDNDPDKVEVRFSSSTSILDYSAVEALHRIALSYRKKNKSVTFRSLCPESEKLIAKANRLCDSIEYTSRDIDVLDVEGIVPDPAEFHDENF